MISVILPVYRNAILLEYSLGTLMANLPQGTEVIVVDDASGAETEQVVQQFPGVRTVVHRVNRGNTAAYNSGATAARGDVFIFLDSDVFVPAGAIELLAGTLEDEQVGAAGSLLLYPQNHTIQHAGIAFDRWVVTHVYAGRPLGAVSFAPIEERQAVTAAFFGCRRSSFDHVGGFDETYRDGMEDVDLCLKFKARGLRNVICTDARALHLESATRGPYKQVRRTYNYSIFFARWAGKFDYDLDKFVERSASTLAPFAEPRYKTKVINFCTTPSWSELASAVTRRRVEVGTHHDFSGFVGEHEPIDLFRAIPLAMHRDPAPALFCVDHIAQLSQNSEWFRTRATCDWIVDRHANVISTQEYGYGR